MTTLEERLARADPAQAYDLLDPAARDAVANIASAAMTAPPARPRGRRRLARRTLVPALAVAAFLAIGAVAAAGWLDAHTDLFGARGMTENDKSEWLRLGSPELSDIAREQGRAYPLPPGGSYEPAIDQLMRRDGLLQANGVRALLARSSACQWEREWLMAWRRSDSERMRRAVAVLKEVPSWPAIRATDGGGTARLHARIAAAARDGAPRVVRADLAVNCQALLP